MCVQTRCQREQTACQCLIISARSKVATGLAQWASALFSSLRSDASPFVPAKPLPPPAFIGMQQSLAAFYERGQQAGVLIEEPSAGVASSTDGSDVIAEFEWFDPEEYVPFEPEYVPFVATVT